MNRQCLIILAALLGLASSCKTIKLSKNVSFQEQLTRENANYLIDSEIDLLGQQVEVPAGATIKMKNTGRIKNGVLSGNNTRLAGNLDGKIGCRLVGSWTVPIIKDCYFDTISLSDAEILSNISSMQSDAIENTVYLEKPFYSVRIPKSGGYAIAMSSNSTLENNSRIALLGNDYKSYSIVLVNKKKNVRISGGYIVGDVGAHTYTANSTHEWGMGVDICESENVEVTNVGISRCTGDGIYVSGNNESKIGVYDHASKHITLTNVVCDQNRRQGLSVIHVDGLSVKDSWFTNTGAIEFTGPGAGIDLEPNVSDGRNMSIRNVNVENCRFSGNAAEDVITAHYVNQNGIPNIENIRFADCIISDTILLRSGSAVFERCSIPTLYIKSFDMDLGGIALKECTIAGGSGLLIHCPNSTSSNSYTGKIDALILEDCRFVHGDNPRSPYFCFWGDWGRVRSIQCNKCTFVLGFRSNGEYRFFNQVPPLQFETTDCTIEGEKGAWGSELKSVSGLRFVKKVE